MNHLERAIVEYLLNIVDGRLILIEDEDVEILLELLNGDKDNKDTFINHLYKSITINIRSHLPYYCRSMNTSCGWSISYLESYCKVYIKDILSKSSWKLIQAAFDTCTPYVINPNPSPLNCTVSRLCGWLSLQHLIVYFVNY